MRNKEESELQKAVVKYLELQYPHVLFCAPVPEIRGGVNAQRAGGMAKAMGYRKGFPDLFIYAFLIGYWNNYYGLAIEFKTAKGKQSESQKEWQEGLEREGYKYAIIRTFEEAKELLDEYLG